MSRKNTKEYRCPVCGKQAIFGQHFCVVKEEFDPDEYEKQWDKKKRKKRIYIVLVAILILIAFAWAETGFFPLVFLIIPGLLIGYQILKGRNGKNVKTRAYNELLLMLGRDRRLVEEVIKGEMNRNPKKTKDECAEIAYEKLLYEKRR